jgi:hypothetical protein
MRVITTNGQELHDILLIALTVASRTVNAISCPECRQQFGKRARASFPTVEELS